MRRKAVLRIRAIIQETTTAELEVTPLCFNVLDSVTATWCSRVVNILPDMSGTLPWTMLGSSFKRILTQLDRKHTGERPFQCHCLKAFSRLDNLRQHCQTVHSDTPERNEEILRKLTVLHSNLAASAAKSQRSYAKVVSTDAPKSDDETKAKEKSSAPRALEKKSSTSPKSSVAVSSLLSIPEPEEYPLDDGRRQSQGTPSAVPLSLNMPILPPLRSKSVPRMFHSTAHPAYNPAGRFSPPTSAYHRSGSGVYVTSPTGSTLPLPASPPSFYSSRGSVNAPYTAEPKSTSALPPLSELSTKLGTPGGSNDPRPYSSRTCPAPQVERSPSSFNDRRATLPISNGSYGYATSGESNGPSYFSGSSNSSFRPYFGTSKFAPYMQSDTRSPPTWNAPAAKRPSSGPHFPNASPSTQRRSSVVGHPSFLQDKASDSMSNHDGAYTVRFLSAWCSNDRSLRMPWKLHQGHCHPRILTEVMGTHGQ